MTVIDQIKILNRKIKQNEAQYDLDREAAKTSALSSNNLVKYEYLTGKDLGLKPSTIEKAKFEYSPLGKILNKELSEEDKKEGLFKRLKNIDDKNEEQLKLLSNTNKKSSIKNESDYNYNNNFAFYKFYRDFQNFRDRSLIDYISNFYKTLNEFKNHKTNTDETQQHNNKAINNVLKLYNNYFDSYEKTFNETNETFDKTTLDKINLYQFKKKVLLPEWLESKNDFNEGKKLIDDIEVDINKVKASKEDKNVFNDLNKLIIDTNNNKVKKEDAFERLNKSISDLDQLKQKQSTVIRNKMVQVVYQLFNSFGFNKEFEPLFSKRESSSEKSELDSKEATELKQINLNEIIKPLWIKLFRNNFLSPIKDVVNNLDNNNYQTMISNNKYDLKNAEQFLMEIITKKN